MHRGAAMIFTGHAELLIDAKGRLQVPSKHRAVLESAKDAAALFCVPWRRHLLMLFPESRFKLLAEKGGATLTPGADQAMGEANYFGLTERLELDSAMRINVPRLHLHLTDLGNEVVMVGAGTRLEVWDKSAWMRDLEERFQKLPEMMRSLEDRAMS
jgi:MraZ protein